MTKLFHQVKDIRGAQVLWTPETGDLARFPKDKYDLNGKRVHSCWHSLAENVTRQPLDFNQVVDYSFRMTESGVALDLIEIHPRKGGLHVRTVEKIEGPDLTQIFAYLRASGEFLGKKYAAVPERENFKFNIGRWKAGYDQEWNEGSKLKYLASEHNIKSLREMCGFPAEIIDFSFLREEYEGRCSKKLDLALWVFLPTEGKHGFIGFDDIQSQLPKAYDLLRESRDLYAARFAGIPKLGTKVVLDKLTFPKFVSE